MRLLVYDCYYNNIKIKTVTVFKEAKEWKEKDSKNTYTERLIDWTNEKEETEKEKEERLLKMKKKIEAIKRKANERRKATVV